MSGGQTGVDRAALDVALALGIPCGGWCPAGRRAEDGPIAPHYPLRETPSVEYPQRTEWNVRDSDGTLIVSESPPTEGTAFTLGIARRLGKPHLVLDPTQATDAQRFRHWLITYQIRILNIAGPRESRHPGIQRCATRFLTALLTPGPSTG